MEGSRAALPSEVDLEKDMDKQAEENLQGVSATMRAEEERMREASKQEEITRDANLEKQRQEDMKGGQDGLDKKFKALEYLLSQSKLYSTIMLSQMQKQEEVDTVKDEKSRKRTQKKEEKADAVAQESQRRTTRTAATKDVDEQKSAGHGRTRAPKLKKETTGSKIGDFFKKEDLENKAGKGATVQDALEEGAAADAGGIKAGELGIQNLASARQPSLVKGNMRTYQLEGLEWLTSLYENGLNGILADEMGLGKTLQTISFIAFLREKGINGPFLIAAPLSTTNNWVEEFKRWTPSIPVILYHGSKPEREEIRRKMLRNPGSETFPIVCTSYEICMNDRKFLGNYAWKYIIIDEGHRLKNLNCRLIRELQSYQSANRLLITGTPLQNNLSELWSLLHFLMPDIFDKLESFESWFDFSALKERNGYEQILSDERQNSVVSSLHAILKPFLLRRVKADVEGSMPKKREYVLYAPMTNEQRELYRSILAGTGREYLEDKVVETLSRNASGINTPVSNKSVPPSLKRKLQLPSSGITSPNKSAKTSRASTPASTVNGGGRNTRASKRKNYEEVSDSAYFSKLKDEPSGSEEEESSVEATALRTHTRTLALAKKQIGQKKLQNPIMQLRLCCNSPHNFYDPFLELDSDAEATTDTTDYTPLVTASGKMRLLDALLDPLLAAPERHKILIFSQFKTQLDLLALYLSEIRGEQVCRIDGSIPPAERFEQIALFNKSPDHRLFLLSTRAGGQGINLAAADTVVLFDSDWNPQQDLQAQDRAHRIGQRRNVLVYRLATRGTVEEMLLEKAEGKRRLEKLVIRKGGMGGRKERGGDEDEGIMDELRNLMGRDDGERLDFKGEGSLLTEEDIRVLTDRSEEAYVRAEEGLDTGGGSGGRSGLVFKAVETRRGGNGLLGQLQK